MARPLPSVVLVGRPNVGKSTLFNRVTRTRRAIVTSVPGTTRDVMAQPVEWRGVRFELIDTGGMFGASEDPLHSLVHDRGRRAILEADLLVLVVDGREGLIPGDREIARVVREAGKPALLAVNKMDDRRARTGVIEMYQLGFDPVFEVAAEHGDGVGDLLDAIVQALPRTPSAAETGSPKPEEVAVAIVGRPNAGKSSLVNRLLREERMIVSETPGTTRDAVDTVLAWHRRTFRIVDTAGIRRPGRAAAGGQVEAVSVLLARRAIEAADVVVVVIDASVGATDQDAAIAGEADRLGRGIIIAANKWDLVKNSDPEFVKGFDEELRRQLKFLDYAAVLHISAATGERTPRLLEVIDTVAQSRRQRVKTADLNTFVERVDARQPRAPARAHSLRGPDGDCSANLRVLHQRGDDLSLLVSAIRRELPAPGVWIRGDAHSDSCAGEAIEGFKGFRGFKGFKGCRGSPFKTFNRFIAFPWFTNIPSSRPLKAADSLY